LVFLPCNVIVMNKCSLLKLRRGYYCNVHIWIMEIEAGIVVIDTYQLWELRKLDYENRGRYNCNADILITTMLTYKIVPLQ
jgi:hypothetical protein